MSERVVLSAGQPAPWFRQRSFANPGFNFDTVGGRYVVLCYMASAADAHSQAVLDAVRTREHLFDDDVACFFSVSCDPADESEGRIEDSYPGFRVFWDFDAVIGKAYGAFEPDAEEFDPARAVRQWFILDPTLRLMKVIAFSEDRSDIAEALDFLDRLPPSDRFAGFEIHAPILILPNVFEADFCHALIDLYETGETEDSGFLREIDGRTVSVSDYDHKRRRDHTIEDPDIIEHVQRRILSCVVPQIARVHHFEVTRMERYLIGCYSAEDGGHFAPHRDNMTSGTAHRRFAVSINLNDDFEGGEVGFPEFGPRRYKAPAGGAVVFSCSLLHSVSAVTRGRRYAFLPFLYDDAAARIREANNQRLAEGVRVYSRGDKRG